MLLASRQKGEGETVADRDWLEARLSDIVRSLSIDSAVFDDRGKPVFHSV